MGGSSKFVNASQSEDLEPSGFEETGIGPIDEKELPKGANSGKARKAIEQLLEEKRLRELLKDDFDDSFEA
ncbi:MAG: hypothetical protein OEW58_01230 [Gammaproteobacteria bacterium]|nr:hypothetical protein [Gammaproteobacteria bacterium]